MMVSCFDIWYIVINRYCSIYIYLKSLGYFQGHSSGAHLIALVTVLDALCPLVGNTWRKTLKPKPVDPALNMPKVAGLIL